MATNPRDEKFIRRVVKRLALRGRRFVRPRVRKATGLGHGSRTLAAALETRNPDFDRSELFIPHYWAVYVHDGRGPFGPKRTAFLVWFRDPKNDPRFPGRITPERARRVGRLTKAQFNRGVEMNRAHLKRGGDPFKVPMVITKGPVKGVSPNKFFSNGPGGGMAGFKAIATQEVEKLFSPHVKSRVGKRMNLTGSVTVRL